MSVQYCSFVQLLRNVKSTNQ